jgi:hypothetical protein
VGSIRAVITIFVKWVSLGWSWTAVGLLERGNCGWYWSFPFIHPLHAFLCSKVTAWANSLPGYFLCGESQVGGIPWPFTKINFSQECQNCYAMLSFPYSFPYFLDNTHINESCIVYIQVTAALQGQSKHPILIAFQRNVLLTLIPNLISPNRIFSFYIMSKFGTAGRTMLKWI